MIDETTLRGDVCSMKKAPSIVYWLDESLYLNITNMCLNRCYFCFRNFSNGVGGFNLRLNFDPSHIRVIKDLQKNINMRYWKEVVFCGFGEPMGRLDCVLEVTRWIKKYHKKKVRINTNGHGNFLNPRRDVVKELKEAAVDNVSVSLNAHDHETYNKVCRPECENAYENVLKFIKEVKREFPTEVTTVAIPEVDIEKVKELAGDWGVRFRKREYLFPLS